MKLKLSQIALFLYGLVFPLLCWARTEGIGEVADNLMDPVTVFSGFVSTISIVVGACFLFASLIKYNQHRVNPLAVPISTVVTLFVMGIILFLLPLIYHLTESGIDYHLT